MNYTRRNAFRIMFSRFVCYKTVYVKNIYRTRDLRSSWSRRSFSVSRRTLSAISLSVFETYVHASRARPDDHLPSSRTAYVRTYIVPVLDESDWWSHDRRRNLF